jgi:hypothetical protein
VSTDAEERFSQDPSRRQIGSDMPSIEMIGEVEEIAYALKQHV